ncbi:MAG: Asp/Glu racemase [Lachnospiraceae bacterium]|jgi:hypothetical protein|nr:Asp/Glu racemase [Lachnospiraceae bacterium]
MKKVAVIHTTPVTIPALKKEILAACGQVEVINLLDDSMLPEINQLGKITPDVRYRLHTLMLLAQSAGADAVLCACSSIGGIFEEGRALLSVPALRIDEPMAERAAAFHKVGVAATLQSTIGPTTELILCKAAALGREVSVDAKVIDNVGTLLAEGREAKYDQIVGDELRKLAWNNDVVVLAQASMARAVAGFGEEERQRFLTSPVSGVAALAKRLAEIDV